MTTISQIRGMLLEETLLYHWQASGFQALVDNQTDSTLNTGSAGLEVVGRSEVHPVGAVAENSVTAPFGWPIRLLLEAKLYADHKAVGIGPLQQAVGLRRDIEEGWMVTSSATPPRRRYDYESVIASTSGFSQSAQRFAFGQHIHLLHLDKIPQMRLLEQAIQQVNHNHFQAKNWGAIKTELHLLREVIRGVFNQGRDERLLKVLVPATAIKPLNRVVKTGRAIPSLLLGTLGQHLTIPLVSEAKITLTTLLDDEWHIKKTGGCWSLTPTKQNLPVFHFNFPPHLLQLHAKQGLLPHPIIQTSIKEGHRTHIINLPLSKRWLDDL